MQLQLVIGFVQLPLHRVDVSLDCYYLLSQHYRIYKPVWYGN